MPLQAARNHLGVVAVMLAAAALAWWWTVQRMAGMDAGPGTDLGSLGWFTGSWAVMMAAMMLPSFAPTLATYVGLSGDGARGRWALFACGYLLVWAAAGVAAYGLYELGKSLLSNQLAWHEGGRWLSGAVLALAAVYQFTPMKRACLARCRGQLGEVRADDERGFSALRTGARSGAWCLGCSWALMAALFALGVMSLTWMVVIALLVALEKTGPRPYLARLANASVLAVLAVGVLAAPHDVPGLVVPGSSGAMHAMKGMMG
jgi:predicted metal-binding membrane protein